MLLPSGAGSIERSIGPATQHKSLKLLTAFFWLLLVLGSEGGFCRAAEPNRSSLYGACLSLLLPGLSSPGHLIHSAGAWHQQQPVRCTGKLRGLCQVAGTVVLLRNQGGSPPPCKLPMLAQSQGCVAVGLCSHLPSAGQR